MTKKASKNEKNLMKIFPKGLVFYYKDRFWKVIDVGKPKTNGGGGEPKTDVYIKFNIYENKHMYEKNNPAQIIAIQISLKATNADFVENKMIYERARQIFKENTDIVLKEILEKIYEGDSEGFLKIMKAGRTDKKHGNGLFLGMRMDFMSHPNGKKSCSYPLTKEQKREIFTGSTLEDSKRNAIVNGVIVENSGVANKYLKMDVQGNETPQEILDNLISLEMDSHFYEDVEIYPTLKGCYYYPSDGYYEGKRALMMGVNYSYDTTNKTFIPEGLIFDNPLKYTTKDAIRNLKTLEIM